IAWQGIATGDGGYCAVNSQNSQNVLVTEDEGVVLATTSKFALGDAKYTFSADSYYCTPGDPGCGDRTNFIAPLAGDPSVGGTFYVGTYRVYRSTDSGQTWKAISDDLTAGAGSVQCINGFGADDDTLTYIAVAPSASDTIYTGSTGGIVNVTFD